MYVCVCERADISHMCINGVIPREIKCMSRRNMHILPPKKTLSIVSEETGEEENENENGSGGHKNKPYMLHVETSILWGGSRKYCVVNTLFSVSLPFAPPSSKLLALISHHVTSHHTISFHMIRWQTHKIVVSLLSETTKPFVYTRM